MSKIPVGATIVHAYRFAFRDFFRILSVMWLPLAVMWLPGLLLQQRMMALSTQMAMRDYSGLRELLPFLLPFYLVCFVLMFMQFIGIARLALGLPMTSRWFYFSLGRPVWRLIGSMLLLFVAVIVGGILTGLGNVLIPILLGLLSRAVNFPPFTATMAFVGAIAMLTIWCGYFYCLVRLPFLLLPVVAAEEEGFALGRSWTLGKGNFWRVFLVLLAIMMPFLVLELALLFGYLFRGVPFPPAHPSAEQTAAFQAAINVRSQAMTNAMYHNWYIVYPAFLIVIVLAYGIWVGAQCFAWRAVTGSAPVAGDGLPD